MTFFVLIYIAARLPDVELNDRGEAHATATASNALTLTGSLVPLSFAIVEEYDAAWLEYSYHLSNIGFDSSRVVDPTHEESTLAAAEICVVLNHQGTVCLLAVFTFSSPHLFLW
jgi:exosome complex RNA-binding protein Rrp42 (RNase PH superfamily)